MFNSPTVVIFDLEYTSWEGFSESGWNQPGRYLEVIQIGAVAVDVDSGFRETGAFQTLVRPQRNPVLSEYIIALTGITQALIDANGIDFPEALDAFMAFVGSNPVQFCSFGDDKGCLETNCGYHGLALPEAFANYVDIREALLNRNLIAEDWFSSDLPSRLGIPSVGRAHDALADCRAIAAALRHFGI